MKEKAKCVELSTEELAEFIQRSKERDISSLFENMKGYIEQLQEENERLQALILQFYSRFSEFEESTEKYMEDATYEEVSRLKDRLHGLDVIKRNYAEHFNITTMRNGTTE